MLFNLRQTGEGEWAMNLNKCLLLQLLPLKGGVGQGKEQGPAVKFPVLKLFRTGYREGV